MNRAENNSPFTAGPPARNQLLASGKVEIDVRDTPHPILLEACKKLSRVNTFDCSFCVRYSPEDWLSDLRRRNLICAIILASAGSFAIERYFVTLEFNGWTRFRPLVSLHGICQ